ncbi:hypothetical protein [Bradyrhizobium sp. RDM4]|uniref:hypothetical protein n=1 Tax=Bradyrhizobium sp. RDM4 TaxID=3378765 RepID=UPI0038FCD735
MTAISPLAFFEWLKWIDGRPLMDTIEEYRRRLFLRALFEFRNDGSPRHNLVLSGRAKKNWKSADLVLAGLYKLLISESPAGTDGFILGNDEDQANQDLSLAKKLVIANAEEIGSEVDVLATEIKRRDGHGSLRILPARNVIGQHGKTATFIGFDEIHGYRNWDLFEALAPDPTRTDVLQWITSYDSIYNSPGNPLYDLKQRGIAGDDPRMLFSWYSGDLCTDPHFAELPPEYRANPSVASWPEGIAYIEQQRRRLPSHKFRRLHLNLPGAPNGAFLDQGAVMAAIVAGRHSLPPQASQQYFGFVDMSGGSDDDAVVAVGHDEEGIAVLDLVQKQAGEPPFNPRHAVERFGLTLKSYRISMVRGDNYAGETFKQDFEKLGISFRSSTRTKTEIYEAFEPALNAGEVELLDLPKLQEQLLALVTRGARIDHEPNGHDDWANAAAGVVCIIRDSRFKKIDDDIGGVVSIPNDGVGAFRRNFDIAGSLG